MPPRAILDSSHQLATGRIDIVAASGANRSGMAQLIKPLLKTHHLIARWGFIPRMGERVEWNQVDLAGQLAQQLGQLLGMLLLIVDALDQGVFYRHDAGVVALCQVALTGVQQHTDIVLAVEWYQLAAQLIGGRMQRYRQAHVELVTEPVKHRYYA